ncbi:MAG TPA: hypothetical protein VJZ00_22550 [Thermoanaerobaculia bacterium]|nr:hypothetical protein [Thermoanaerobaculia bacterium]
MTLVRIEGGDVARRQIKKLNTWWRKNRTAAPTAVQDELTRAFRLLLNQPRIGPLEPDEVIEVLSIWSDSRGERPPL